MTAKFVPAPPVNVPMVDEHRMITRPWLVHLLARHEQAGGSADKIDAAHAAALAAVPQTTEVVALGGLHNGGALGGNVAVTLYRAQDLAANLPVTGISEGDMAYATNGLKSGEAAGAGTGCQVWWSAGAWFAIWSGLAVTV